jgi:hypothetical protein
MFSQLVVFRMHHDCTDLILSTVAKNNLVGLRVVDVQYSQYVSDTGTENQSFNV